LKSLGPLIRRRPRTIAALAFGVVTGLVTHFAWVPDARFSGAAPVLTLGAGVAHAIAAAITAPRLVDGARTRTSTDACLVGAATSLIALALVAPSLAMWVSSTNAGADGVFPYLLLTLLVGLFSFLAAGWALLIASAATGWILYRLASRTPELGRAAGA
jgi:hypothetical protein